MRPPGRGLGGALQTGVRAVETLRGALERDGARGGNPRPAGCATHEFLRGRSPLPVAAAMLLVLARARSPRLLLLRDAHPAHVAHGPEDASRRPDVGTETPVDECADE